MVNKIISGFAISTSLFWKQLPVLPVFCCYK